MDLVVVIIAALAGSVFSLIGGFYLVYGGKGADTIQRLAVPFAAGALLAAAFVDLLPEAIEAAPGRATLLWALGGILFFFVLERGLRWFHHHHAHQNENNASQSLIVIGDTIHNLIDGVAIGAAFLVNPATGIVATIAVAAHEIPQEVGDFGLLLAKGMRRRMVVLVNLLSAFVTVLAAVVVVVFEGQIGLPITAMLALTAGFFIYIAVSDIIPTIHAEKDHRQANVQTVVLLFGVVLISLLTTSAHHFIPENSHGHASVVKGIEG